MTNCEARYLIQKIKSHTTDLCTTEVNLKFGSKDMIECHTADLNNMSSFVRFRQSTHDHIRVSDCLNLKMYVIACADIIIYICTV